MPLSFHLARTSRLVAVLVAFVLISCLAGTASAQGGGVQFIVDVGDTTGYYGEQNSVITVYLNNFEQEIGAFTLWLRLSRIDLAKFQTDIDTVVDTTYWHCIDGTAEDCMDKVTFVESLHGAWDPNFDFTEIDTIEALIGNLDTVGTLIQGWEYVETRNIDNNGNDIRVTALANVQGDGHYTQGIQPNENGVLFRLRADILPEPDSVDTLPRANLEVISDAKQWFVFSRPDGVAIGYYPVEVPDTNYWRCLDWDGPDCIEWEPVQLCNPCDSIEYGVDSIAELDTTEVVVIDGSITALIKPYVCGNVDNDPDDIVDLGDVLYLANAVFLGGPPIEIPETANTDCSSDGIIDLGDLLVLANGIFLGGPAPCTLNGGC